MTDEPESTTLKRRTPDMLDLRTLGLIARRRFKIFLIVALLIAIPGIAVLPLLSDYYSATTNVLIDRRETEVTNAETVLDNLPGDSASVDTEVQVLRSPALVRKVVEKLKLEDNPEFNPALGKPGLVKRIKNGISSLFREERPANLSNLDVVTLNVIDKLDISRRGLTYVIGVTFTSQNPRMAAAVPNALAEEYLAQQVKEKRLAASDAQDFINSRLSGLGREVQSKDVAIENIRARAGISDSANVASYDEQAISTLSGQALELKSQLEDKRSKLAAAQGARSNPSSLSSIIESPTIRDLKSQRNQALANSAEAGARYGPQHPEAAKVRQQLEEIDRALTSEMQNIIASLSSDVTAAERRLGSVQAALSRQRARAVSTSRSAARVSQIEREASAPRSVYEDFRRRSMETGDMEDLARPDASIVNRAVTPNEPSGPNRTLYALVIALMAFAAGLLAVIMSELLDVKLSSGLDVERHLGIPNIASIPLISKADDTLPLDIIQKPLSVYAEAFRALGSQVSNPSDERDSINQNAHVVMITSSLPHEGKTTVSASFALSMSSTKKRVLLIDADMRRPQVGSALAIDLPRVSIPAILDGTGKDRNHLFEVEGSDVKVMAIDDAPENTEIFRNGVFDQFLDTVRNDYDFIVVDTPPVLAVSDAQYIAPDCDDVLLVGRWRRTSRFAARAAVNVLSDVDAPITGMVLNGVNPKTQSLYSKDDALVFYKEYKHYYAE